jgi:hypothetical protein
MSRAVKAVIGAVVGNVIIVVAAVCLLSSIDSLIKTAVETYGSEAMKATVQLDDVEVSPTSGQGTMRGLFVGNPQGFDTASAFKLGAVSVRLDIGTLGEDTIVINEIIIDKPEVTYEIGTGGSNIDALKRNVNAYAGTERKGTAGKKADGAGPKLVITKLRITGGVVNVSAAMLKGKKLSAPLPTIELNDIGKEKGGASPGEVIEQVIERVSQSVGKSVATLNLGDIIGGAGKQAREALDKATAGTEGAKEAIEKGTGEIGDALKGLLPKFK